MKLFFGGRWQSTGSELEVTNPYDGAVIDTVPKATAAHVDQALVTLERGAAAMRSVTAYERSQILRRAAEILRRRTDELALTISSEEGKILEESRGEVGRACETL